MITVGLTGGIGSGKTTVAAVFQSLGVPVFNSDEEAKACYTEDSELKAAVEEHFGHEVFNKHGVLQSEILASRVFSNEVQLRLLNSLVHPAVGRRFNAWKLKQNSSIVMKEAAILFESGANHQTDYNILVSAPVDMRIERIAKRNGWPKEEILKRMSRQWPEEKIRSLCDYEIVNDGRLILPQIVKVHEDILRSANS
jgi:dephospho-CoA kinase